MKAHNNNSFFLSNNCYIDLENQQIVDMKDGNIIEYTHIGGQEWDTLKLLVKEYPHGVSINLIKVTAYIKDESDVRKVIVRIKQKHRLLSQWIPRCSEGKYRLQAPLLSDIITTPNELVLDKYSYLQSKYIANHSSLNNSNYDEYGDTPLKPRSILKSTQIHMRPVFIVDETRKKIFDDIENAFENGGNAVFLHGMGGIGKSELAKQYAKRHIGKNRRYDTVIFAPIDVKKGNDNLQSLINNDEVFNITNFAKRNEIILALEHIETNEAYFSRKLTKLKEICDNRTLIIIDNFDITSDTEIFRFLEGNYHVIVTTRHCFPGIDCPVIEVETMCEECLKDLFFQNSSRYDINRNDKYLLEIFQVLGHHTMAIEIIAKLMKENGLSTFEMLSDLQNRYFSKIDIPIQLSVADEEQTPFDYIKSLFDVSSLLSGSYADEYKTILSCMTLMPLSGVLKKDFFNWCEIKRTSTVNRLIQRSWLSEYKKDNSEWISMHPVICEVMTEKFNPDLTKCKVLINNLSHKAKTAYYMKLDEASYFSKIVTRIISLYPIVSIDNYKIYLDFAYFLSTYGEFVIAKEIISTLYRSANTTEYKNSVVMADICRQFGTYYSNTMYSDEAINWREKAIKLYQKHNTNFKEIAEIKRLLVWDYIHISDIDTATKYFKEWSSSFDGDINDSKYKGQSLHMNARLLYEQGDYWSAIKNELLALEIFEQLETNNIDWGSCLYVLGLCYIKSESHFDMGIRKLKECLDIWKKYRKDNSSNVIDILVFIADAYFSAKDYPTALNKYENILNHLNSLIIDPLYQDINSYTDKITQRIRRCNELIQNPPQL